MKIGDKVFVHGYVDEIMKDIIIIRNKGGYFGTVPDETVPSEQPESCDGCKWEYAFGYVECYHCERNFNDMYEVREDE